MEKQNIPQSEQFQNLMKNKTSHTVRTVPKSNRKIVETGKYFRK
jgi:hypothetical protein